MYVRLVPWSKETFDDLGGQSSKIVGTIKSSLIQVSAVVSEDESLDTLRLDRREGNLISGNQCSPDKDEEGVWKRFEFCR